MKKEELIAKAAERGITLTESQMENYVAISDEELENVAGGILCGFKREITDQTIAENCSFFKRWYDDKRTTDFLCCRCENLRSDMVKGVKKYYCINEEAWQ
ncbi:MAG: hypothetical protein LBL98_07995 [Ruminococcus sp.]|jgi:hypothetical protein|nr:hypothetical protein [Ruminococcus sp.]